MKSRGLCLTRLCKLIVKDLVLCPSSSLAYNLVGRVMGARRGSWWNPDLEDFCAFVCMVRHSVKRSWREDVLSNVELDPVANFPIQFALV